VNEDQDQTPEEELPEAPIAEPEEEAAPASREAKAEPEPGVIEPAQERPAKKETEKKEKHEGGLDWRARLSPVWFLIYQALLLGAAYKFTFGNLMMGLLQTGGLFLLSVHLVWLLAQEPPTASRKAYLRVFLISAVVLGVIAAAYVYFLAQVSARN